MENWGRGQRGRGLGRREGGRWEGKGEAKGGPLRRRARGLPREGGGRGGGARWAAATLGAPERRSWEGRGGGAKRRGALGRSGLPLPEVRIS